jgi:hypothetical protein
MKIRPVAAELFRAGGQTDTTKLIVAFRNFANATKKLNITMQCCASGGTFTHSFQVQVQCINTIHSYCGI